MSLPKVVIVGRPNVGKSSIFNWLARHRVAIVDPTAGVTRDRVDCLIQESDRTFELVDTGGMGISDADGLTDDVERQIQIAMDEATLIVFVVDAKEGATALDELVMARIRRSGKPILFVANKCDNDHFRGQAAEFGRFGMSALPVSALGNRGRDDLLRGIAELLPESDVAAPVDVVMKIAVVGKRNVGKSTFINCLAKSERMIVSEVPGTTRDAVDVRFERNGKAFIAIDTAGVRRARSIADSIEFYSFARAQRSIRRADVVLFFLDPLADVSNVDKKLADDILERAKPCVLVVNKWDLAVERTSTEEFNDFIERELPALDFAPRAFITAKTGRNVLALVDLCQSLYHQANARVPTAELNRVLAAAVAKYPPPYKHNRRVKFLYATQTAVAPPTIVIFCNRPGLIDDAYRRYLVRFFRDELPFSEVPIRLHLRQKRSAPKEAGEEQTT